MTGASAALLPDGYASLEPFVEQWAIAGTANRDRCRSDSTAAERLAFFNAARELVSPALAQLDQKPFKQFDERDQRLMNLMLSFAHVAMAVEIQGSFEAKHAQLRRHMVITRSPADVNA